MNVLIRLFDLDAETGYYNDRVYTQWELPLGTPTPRVGEYIYTSPNGCETARVDSVTYSYGDDDSITMIDCNVTLYNRMEDNDD